MNNLTIIEKHSRILRWTHWLNFLLLSLMIWSGILIYWADQAFLPIPKPWAERLHLNNRLAEGMGWHFLIMWPFTINGIIYVTYLLLSGQWRREKYQGAQKVAYFLVPLLGAGTIISGLAIYKPVQLGWLTELLGGYRMSRFIHFAVMAGLLLFIIVHVIQVIRHGWNNFRSMIAGYEIEKD